MIWHAIKSKFVRYDLKKKKRLLWIYLTDKDFLFYFFYFTPDMLLVSIVLQLQIFLPCMLI